MNIRAAFIFLVLAFIGLLILMGTVGFIRWLKATYPRHFISLLFALVLALVGMAVWVYMEANDRPTFHAGDLITLQEPVVARVVDTERNSPETSCIIDIYKHLSVVSIRTGTLRARIESNTPGSAFCSIDAHVHIELAWLHRYTLTHRHS